MATVTQDNDVYEGVANTGALKADKAAGDTLYQLDVATGQLVPAGSQGTQGDKGYYTENANATAAAQAAAATTAQNTAAAAATAAGDATQLQSASSQISTFLSSVPGLSSLDPSGALAAWMSQQASTLAGQGLSSGDIMNTIESTMNNPSGDPAAQAVFDALFPGYNQKIQNGTTNADGSYTGIAGYISYASQIQQYAQTANLAPGTITAQDIGDMWAGNVSAGEVSDRITMAASNAAVAMSNPTVGSYLQNTFGINQGTLTSYYLNPTNTLQTINAVNTGIAGETSGFGSLSQSAASSLAAFLATPSTNGVSPVSTQQAQQALTTNLGNGMTSAAGMATANFENANPGQQQGNPGVINQSQIIGAVEGNASDLAAARLATGTRAAGTAGGGGAVNNASGVQGVGFGSAD